MPNATASKKPNTSRNLTPEQLRLLAEHAENEEAEQRKQNRKQRFKRAAGVPDKRWATEQNTKVAEKQDAAARREQAKQAQQQPSSGDEFRERQRKGMIRARNRRRRLPWYPALSTVAYGLLAEGSVWLFATADVAPVATAGVMAAVPAATAVAASAKTDRKWLPEIALGGLASAGITFWIGLAGLSWLAVLAVLVGTITLGARWWKSNPIGPGVAPLEPPRPAAPPVPPTPSVQLERDEHVLRWQRKVDKPSLLPGSRLTNRVETSHIVAYDVELDGQSYQAAQHHIAAIAAALGLAVEQLIIERPRKNEQRWRPSDRARLSIIEADATAEPRFYTGPNVEVADNGTAAVIKSLARYRDGQGEAQVTMWNKTGMVPTAVIGGTGGGKSAGANALSCGALSTGLLNLMYIDFKGNSSSAIRQKARIVVVGENSSGDVAKLVNLLRDVRIGDNPDDILFPSRKQPGWMMLIDEVTKGIKEDQKFAQSMENMVTTARSLGIWPVAMTQDMHVSAWHNDNVRSAFSKQAICYYVNSKSGNDLLNGLTYDPANLPTHDPDESDLGEDEQPVAGFAVHVRTYRPNVPCRWDWLPGDNDPVNEEPPYRASAAFDEFFDQPGMWQAEYDALVAALGPPNPDGRWIIGRGGTHTFPEDNTSASTGRPRRTTGFGGKPLNEDTSGNEDDLSNTQRRVLQLIEDGTTKTGDLEHALGDKASRATVHRDLGELVAANLIHRASKGEYALGPEPSA